MSKFLVRVIAVIVAVAGLAAYQIFFRGSAIELFGNRTLSDAVAGGAIGVLALYAIPKLYGEGFF